MSWTREEKDMMGGIETRKFGWWVVRSVSERIVLRGRWSLVWGLLRGSSTAQTRQPQ